MTGDTMFGKLRARRIFQVGLVYLGLAWLAMQVGDILVDREIVPGSYFPPLLYLLVVGFPIVLTLAWAHERRPAKPVSDEVGWRAWAHSLRPGYVLATLLVMVALLLPAYLMLERGPGRSDPDIEAAATLPSTSIAVLYFDDHSEGGQLDYLAKSLTEHLIHELAQVKSLDVKSRNAVKPYREGGVPDDSIARKLGVGTLVEGSVTGSRERVRVSVQLIDANTQSHLDSEVIPGTLDDPFELIDNVTDQISRSLRRRLGIEVRLQQLRAGASNEEAWDLVQQAFSLTDDVEALVTAGDTAGAARTFDRADELLRRAESADPDWIEPILARARVASDRAFHEAPDDLSYEPSWARVGLEHVERALAIAPDDPSALERRGILLYYLTTTSDDQNTVDSLRNESERDLKSAVSLEPSRALAWNWLSRVLQARGQFLEAKLAAGRAYEADAFLDDARIILFRLCHNSLELRDWVEVTRWCGEGRRRYPDRPSFVAVELTALAGPEGPAPDVEKAWELERTLLELSAPQRRVDREPRGLMQVAAVLVRAELSDSARAIIELARAAMSGSDPEVDYYEANARLRLGETEEALRLLGDFLDALPGEKPYIAEDWWWESLHDDPRFKALVAADDPT
jgi:TolB-like protein